MKNNLTLTMKPTRDKYIIPLEISYSIWIF